MSEMLRKRLIPAEFLVASSLLLAPSLGAYGIRTEQSAEHRAKQPNHSDSRASTRHSFGYPSLSLDSARPGE